MSWKVESEVENTEETSSKNKVTRTQAKKIQLQNAGRIVYNRPNRDKFSKTSSRDALSDPVTVRMSLTRMRFIDEFLAHRVDTVLNTRSDLIRDAIDMWVTVAAALNPDDFRLSASLLVEMKMENLIETQRRNKKFILDTEDALRDNRHNDDVVKTIINLIDVKIAAGSEDDPPHVEALKQLKDKYKL